MNQSPDRKATPPLGYEAFAYLNAENEGDWLPRVLEPPLELAPMASIRSIMIFGASGSGKTTLRRALYQQANQSDDRDKILFVHWQFSQATDAQPSLKTLDECLQQVLNACARALLQNLGYNPAIFNTTPSWNQETLRWFIHQHLFIDRELYISRLEEECPPEGKDLLNNLFSQPPRMILPTNAGKPQVIKELTSAIQHLGFEQVWLVIDGLEPWISVGPDETIQTLRAFLSTLALFEAPCFVFKLIAPLGIKSALTSSGGLARRRLVIYDLDWSSAQLRSICERRLAAAVGQAEFKLSELCTAGDLPGWLAQYGGNSPRSWLELLCPLIDTFLMRQLDRPLNEAEWLEIRQLNPPRLRIDFQTSKVFLENYEIPNLQPGAKKILLYLYRHRHRICTRSELYFCAYRGRNQVPKVLDDQWWEAPSSYRGTIDNLVWRLRKAIEPNPKQPIYIVTEINAGLRLDNSW